MKKFEELKSLNNTIKNELTSYNEESNFMVSGLTSDFDRLFELSWKVLKEYMYKELGISAAKTGSPRDILGLAYKEYLIENDKVWLNMLKDRNDDAHIYSESAARSYASRIRRDYLKIIDTFIDKFSTLISDEASEYVKIPSEFIKLANSSSLFYDEYLAQALKTTGCSSGLELFANWDNYKDMLG
jgi:nucleotidyltransferase substrate binding protein (TIGR01987 family)